MDPGRRVLAGRELAAAIRAEAAAEAAELTKTGRQPRLAVVTANDDGGSAAYLRSIVNAAAKEGIACDVARTTTVAGIIATLARRRRRGGGLLTAATLPRRGRNGGETEVTRATACYSGEKFPISPVYVPLI